MIPDRIGIIGSMQGVKASSTPNPKKAATSAHGPPLENMRRMRPDSEASSCALVRGPAAMAALPSSLLGGACAEAAPRPSIATVRVFSIGG
jgi:hypothetical protein